VKRRSLNRIMFYTVALLLLINISYAQDKGAPKEEKKEEKKQEPPPSSMPYEYSSENKLDPFLPFKTAGKGPLPTTFAGKPESGIEPGTSPVFTLTELKFTGVLRKGNEVWAVLTTPEGRGLVVKKGMTLGKERAIVSNIIFEDRPGPSGVREIRKVVLKVPVTRGEGVEDYDEIEIMMESTKAKEPES